MLKSLLEEMKIQFEIASTKDKTSLNEKETNKRNFWEYDF
jgi:hypothetical protein